MLKKLIIVSILLLTTVSIAFAGPCKKKRRVVVKRYYVPERRYYVPDYKAEVPRPQAPCYTFTAGPYVGIYAGIRNNFSKISAFYQGAEGGLFAGYAVMLTPNLYFGAEIFGGDSAKIFNYKCTESGLRSTWTFGIDLMPGVVITDYVLLYFRGGVARTRFSNISDSQTGWRTGVGLQVNLCGGWDLRSEYIYGGYRTTDNVAIPRTDQYNMGLVYKFC